MASKDYAREQEDSWVAPYEVSCTTCTAACCRAPTEMTLSRAEYQQHRHTIGLEPLVKPRDYPQQFAEPLSWVTPDGNRRYFKIRGVLPADHGVYKVAKDCGNLQADHSCGIYSQRPWACQVFEMGSPACLRMRRTAGLDQDQPPLDIPMPDDAQDRDDPLAGVNRDVVARRGATTPPIDAETARSIHHRATTWIEQHIATLTPEQWATTTPCTGWTVFDLAAHLLNGQLLVAEVLNAAREERPAQTPPTVTPNPAEIVEALTSAMARARAAATALLQYSPMQTIVIDGNSITLEVFVQVYAAEITMHVDDIASALGVDHPISASGLRALAAAFPWIVDPGAQPPAGSAFVLRTQDFELPFTWRANEWRVELADNPCFVTGPSDQVIRFAYGRVTFEDARITTTDPELAAKFKLFLPGP